MKSKLHSLSVIAVFLILSANGLAFEPPSRIALPDFDRRLEGAQTNRVESGDRQAAVAQLQTRLPKAQVEFDPVSRAPKFISAGDQFLTGANGQGKSVSAAVTASIAAGDPHRPAKAFLKEHRELFGHGPEALDRARIKREFVTPHSGMKTVVWEQHVDGIPLFESVFIAHTTAKGELVNISSQFLPDPVAAADRGVTNRAALAAAPAVSARQAVAIAARNIGMNIDESAVALEPQTNDWAFAGPERRQFFSSTGFKGKADAKLIWLPMSQDRLRLCWDVTVMSRARGEMFRVLVDVQTGEPLLRHCLTDYISDASYRVYTSDSPSPFSPSYSTPVTNQPPFTNRVLLTLPALDTNASPSGWINDGGNETLGNNVDAHTDWNADNVADLPRPHGSPSRVFDFPLDLAQAPHSYSNAAVVQLFYWNNFMHDKLYELGFTEAAGNFQSNNFGRGGLGNDAVQADAQDGSGFNNANFSTPADGSPGRMQMYLFDGVTPNRDGDLDAEVILHEYTHGLSNRRVGGGVGISALQTQGMGEGWSDFYAMALLSEATDDVNGVYAYGGYVTYQLSGLTQNYYYGIRRYPYCTDTNKNPLTFKDIDPAQASSHTGVPRSPIVGTTANEVHNMGEVWCSALREARANLITKYGWHAGNQLILQLVTDGMNLSPANPTFLQARDAILQADQVDNGGMDLTELWAGFAKRGMGKSATSPASSTTTGVHEAFDVPFLPLQITIPSSATEGDGVLAGAGQVTLPNPVGSSVVVQLSSSDTTQATVPASVTIPSGQTNATFDVTIIDDTVLDGTQTATITASAIGFANGYGTISVFDNETATLSVALPATATKGQGTVQGTVQVSAPVAANVTVGLSSSGTNLIQVPASVIILSGQTSAVFTATILTDGQINGGQTVNVTAHVQNWTDGTAAVTVQDNMNLTVTLPASAWENAGVLANAGSVSMAGISAANEMISLTSSQPAVLTVPSAVTILAGSTSNTFNITLINNGMGQSNQTVTVTASASGFTNGVASILVLNPGLPPIPSNPQPGNLATNVLANTNLMWSNGLLSSNQLVLNGGFETGSLTNWTLVPSTTGTFVINNGTVDPPSPDGPLPPFAGSYSALGRESGPGIFYMYQTIFIPTNAASVTLGWAHRVRNFYSSFSTNQQFQVRICDTNNNVLATPFTTKTGDTLLGNWIQTNYNLTSFAGKKVRVMFWVNPGSYYLDVHVDNVSVVVNAGATNSSGLITSDVYFGTNPTPGPAEYQGSTTNSSWTLPVLAPLTTYYWQIVANGEGTTTGPVWQFTTAAVDHFAWNTIASPQYVNQPFGVTVTAQDAFNSTVSNYTGRVFLQANVVGGGNSTIEDFESGIWPHSPWVSVSGTTLGTISSAYAHDGNYGLSDPEWIYRTDVAVGNAGDGLSWWIRPGTGRAYLGFGVSASGCWSVVAEPNASQFGIQQNSGYGFLGIATNNQTWQAGKWYKVGVQFVSTSSVTCNLYDSDGTTLLNSLSYANVTGLPGGVAMRSFGGFSLDTIQSGLGSGTTIPISPTNSGNFINGTWSGNIIVLQPATNVVLLANDGNGHTGSSNPFTVTLPPTPPVIILQPINQAVTVGGAATFAVQAGGTPPLSYQWSFNSTNIVGATNTTLTLTNVQFSQAGNYAVVVTNLYGSTNSATAVLTVNPPPPCDPAPSGLVGWWPGEGNALDNVSGNNGNLANVTFVPGWVGQAFSFNGSNSSVDIPQAANLNVGGQVTIEFWMKADLNNPLNNYQGLVTSDFYQIEVSDGVNFVISTDGGASYAETKNANGGHGPFPSSGQWHHVAGTYDGTNLQLYIDGQASGNPLSHTGTISPMQPAGFVSIGSEDGRFGITDRHFWGLIDEASIYNRALSANEIAAIYNAGSSGKCSTPTPPVIILQPINQAVTVGGAATFAVQAGGTPPLSYQWSFNSTNIVGATNTTLTLTNVQFSQAGNYAVVVTNLYGSTNSATAVLTVNPPPPCDPAPSGLVGWWPGEGNALDNVSGNNGNLANVTFVPGWVGQAFSFNGSNSSVDIPQAANLNVGGQVTIEFWMKADLNNPLNNYQGLVTSDFYQIEVSDGVNFVISTDGGASYAETKNANGGHGPFPSSGQWHHVAGTYDGTNLQLYIDGQASGNPLSHTGTISPMQPAGFVSIGSEDGRFGITDRHFWGLIDEASIYNRALSANEIAAIYNAGSSGKCSLSPSITNQPASQRVTIGCNAAFNVGAAGAAPLSYQWWKGNLTLNGHTNSILTLTNVQATDFTNYYVVVTNGFGSVTSSNAVLSQNHPPVAVQDIIQRLATGDVKVQVSTLLTNDTDADGDALTFLGVSTNSAAGGTVYWSGDWVYYLPPAGYTNSDAFTYTISDGYCGGTATGNVLVQVVTASGSSHNFRIYVQPDGSVLLIFAGIPGWTYRIQYADTLPPVNWTDLSTNTADALGIYQYIDVPPTNSPTRFYRSVSP